VSKRFPDRPSGPLKMRDIATLAGVSTATVSRVLHNSPLVDPKTAEAIQRIIKKANYIPNNTGKALKSGHSGIFGLMVPDLGNPFFADFVQHFEQRVVDRDQEMLLAISNHRPDLMLRSTRRMLMRGVDGIVILESEIETESYETVLHNQVPLVTMNRLVVEPGVSDVAIDVLSGQKKAISYLKKAGHRHIVFLSGIAGQKITEARNQSFLQAMKSMHLACRRESIVYSNFTVEGGFHAMETLLHQKVPVSAVLCANDLSAIGAHSALRSHGLTPGRDISIIGLDDIPLDTMISPPLSTLSIARDHLARLCYDALARLLLKPNHPGEQLFLGVDLVLRESTGPCRERVTPVPSRGKVRS